MYIYKNIYIPAGGARREKTCIYLYLYMYITFHRPPSHPPPPSPPNLQVTLAHTLCIRSPRIAGLYLKRVKTVLAAEKDTQKRVQDQQVCTLVSISLCMCLRMSEGVTKPKNCHSVCVQACVCARACVCACVGMRR